MKLYVKTIPSRYLSVFLLITILSISSPISFTIFIRSVCLFFRGMLNNNNHASLYFPGFQPPFILLSYIKWWCCITLWDIIATGGCPRGGGFSPQERFEKGSKHTPKQGGSYKIMHDPPPNFTSLLLVPNTIIFTSRNLLEYPPQIAWWGRGGHTLFVSPNRALETLVIRPVPQNPAQFLPVNIRT